MSGQTMRNEPAENGGLWGGVRRVLKALGLWRNGHANSRDTLEEYIEEKLEDEVAIDPHEGALIRNVLGLRDITAEDVMVPRADIVGVAADMSLSELATEMAKVAHSRMPVYRDDLDDVVGMVHIKDVLAHLNNGAVVSLSNLVRKVLFVAPSIRALDLLQEMRVTRQHLALVVDEFGGIDGLITIEDLVEEIVGEISDEHDVVEGPKLRAQGDGVVIADARATVEEFEEMFGAILSEEEREEIDTLGGLVFSLTGRVATRGEVILHEGGVEFEVLDADPRRIRRLLVRRLDAAGDENAPEADG